MSDQLILLPVSRASDTSAILVTERRDGQWKASGNCLGQDKQGRLEVQSQEDSSDTSTPKVRFAPTSAGARDSKLAIVPCGPGVMVQGRSVLGIKVLRPGEVLSISGVEDHLLVRRYQPSGGQVPESHAKKPCGVCGMELSMAPVVACACGTYYHYELDGAGETTVDATVDATVEAPVDAAESDDDAPLNCFLEARYCLVCQREKTLAAMLIPEPAALGF